MNKNFKYTKTLLLIFFCGLFLPFGKSQTTPDLPEGFYDEKVGDNWNRPVGIVFDENGQGYVWEKGGKVYILDKEGHKLETPLLDISEEVLNWGDHGMLGFALDPGFTSNGYFYVFYALDPHYLDFYGTDQYDPGFSTEHEATIGRITRFQADFTNGFQTLVEGSRKVILGKDRPDGPSILLNSHGIGSLVFGTDGTLMASVGDAGSYESIDVGNTPSTETYWEQAVEEGILNIKDNVGAWKSLQVQNMNGSILRIDPETGVGVPSNPYYNENDPYAAESRIWVLGFRNPFRFIKLPETGSHFQEDGDPGVLFIGDVGAAGWEELNVATEGGQCFGWPMFEGHEYHWGFVSMPTENPYAPNPNGCGNDYFGFNDLIKNANNKVDPVFTNPCNSNELIPSDIPTFVHRPPNLAWSGLIWNPPPRTMVPAYNEESGILEPLQIKDQPDASFQGKDFPGFTSIPGFMYTGESFPEEYHNKYFHADLSGWIRIFEFDEEYHFTKVDTFAQWPDKGVVHIAYNPHEDAIYWCHIYESELHKITFGQDPRPVASFEVDQQFGPGPLSVQFDASPSFDPDGGPITYEWNFGDGTSSTDKNPTHTFEAPTAAPTAFDVQLIVYDSIEQTDEYHMTISLNNTPPVVDINTFKDGDTYPQGAPTYLPLRANVTDAEHSAEELSYKWEAFLHHNNHYHPEEPDYEIESSAIIEPLGCQTETYWYRIRLTVTDAHGLATIDEKEVFPYCGDPFFEILDLSGKITDNQIPLQWTSQFETEMVRFEIQRTEDFRFETIGEVAAIGTTNSPTNYQFTDTNPVKGDNYYRIKGVNENGEYMYSNVFYADFIDVQDVSLYPNPTKGEVTLILINAEEGVVELELFNTVGQAIYRVKRPVESGRQRIDISLSNNIPEGLYYYRITNGQNKRSSSIILHR